MPRVPTLDNFGVLPNELPNAQAQPVAPRIDAGQPVRQLGQATERAGETAMAIENDTLQRANQIRVDDALNKALEAENRLAFDPQSGFTNQRGLDALERASGKPLSQEYSDDLAKEHESIAAGLSNDWQRRAFADASGRRLASFRASAMRHESQEFQTYTLSVREGTISTRMNQIGLNYNNPQVLDDAVESIRAASYDIAKLQGKSATWADSQARKMTSNAYKVALATALEKNDITYADDLMKRAAPHMEADDILQVRGLITKEMDLRVGVGAATDVMGKVAPKMVTNDFDRLVNITLASESGGRRFGADGALLTSPKGAKGEMQVLDSTNGNPGFGVKPAADNSPEERARVGRDYLAAMVKRYDGDLSKAWAAYNAGPGAVDKAMRQADATARMAQRDPTLPVQTWLEAMPQETRDYVAKNMQAYGAGQGQYARPTLAELDAQLQANPQIAGNPERLKAARAELKRQYDAVEQTVKQREEEGVAGAMRALVANGGDIKALPTSVRAMIPAQKYDDVMGFADKIRKGDDTTSLWLYNKLESNPSQLAALSDDAFYALRRELSDADFKHFSNERAKLQGKSVTGSNSPEEMNTQSIREGLGIRLQSLGLDPTPKDGSKEAQRVGAIRQFVNTYIAAAQKEAGKKFSDVEVSQQLDALFAKNATLKGWLSDSSAPLLTIKSGDVPTDAKQRILDAFKRRGVTDPTESQILTAYWTSQTTRRQ